MKTLLMLLLNFLTLSLLAQNVTLTFTGANKNRNYQVVIDGANYYSANSVSTNSNRTKVISVPNLSLGSHELVVYRMGNNNNIYTDGNTSNSGQGQPVYNKTFELREGYDMNITVRANGVVSFSEKRAEAQYSQGAVQMSATAFNQFLINVRNKNYQSDRINMIRNAFTNSVNSFTTSQVRQLLLLVNAESRRLELAKLSYKTLSDPANFSYVYDVLNSEASRTDLDDYVVEQGGSISTIEDNAAFGTAMSAASFNQLLQRVQNRSYQADKISEIRSALTNSSNYFFSF